MAIKKTGTILAGFSAAAFLSTAFLCGAQAFAQGAGQTASAADKKFVQKAMEGGMAEVELGQLAVEKASSPDVKNFGQRMVDDHTKMNEQMKPVGARLGIAPPSQLPPKEQALKTKLAALSGTTFDKAYINAMVADHKEDDKEFKNEEINGKDPQVKDAATQGESVIAQHLQLAESIQKKLKQS